jgi:hypothetical protein
LIPDPLCSKHRIPSSSLLLLALSSGYCNAVETPLLSSSWIPFHHQSGLLEETMQSLTLSVAYRGPHGSAYPSDRCSPVSIYRAMVPVLDLSKPSSHLR